MKRILFLFPLLTVILTCSSQAIAKDNWTRVQTKNFTIVGSTSPDDMKKIGLKLEEFRETLQLMFPRAKLNTPVPTTVILFKTDDAFHPFKPRYQGKIRENVGGYFLQGRMINYIVLATDKQRTNPYRVIFHEYEHFIVDNNMNHVPAWLGEGLAEFFSTFETDGEQVKIGSPILHHVHYLRESSPLPMKTLLSVDHKSPEYNESRKTGAFYAGSWALVHYLMVGNGEKKKPQLIRFMDLVNSGTPAEESFQKAFQTTPKLLEEELISYITKFTFPVLVGKYQHKLEIDRETQVTTLSDAEANYFQGVLLLSMGQSLEAKEYLQKSQSLDATLAATHVALGRVALAERKLDDADKFFKFAVGADPNAYLGHYYRGEMLSAKKEFLEAVESYKKAIALKPDLAWMYSDLGYAYVNAGNREEAIKNFEKGLRINPREGDFYRSLAYSYSALGNAEYAAAYSHKYLTVKGWRENSSQYMVLSWYFSLREMTQHEFASKSLRDSIPKVVATEWPFPVLQYLTKAIPLTDLMSLAKDDVDKLTEAHAYAGLEFSFNGDRDAAVPHLRWVIEKGNKNFVEYAMASKELARIERAR
jgi:tetratricopeptide (TPR) repeat protein